MATGTATATSAAISAATPIPRPFPTSTPFPAATPSATFLPPTATATFPPPTSTATLPAQVALGQCRTYTSQAIRTQLEGMFETLGGLETLVKRGARVGLKVNLTGGTWWDTPAKPPATETFVTHPAVAGAVAELLKDCGASTLYIMDGAADETCWAKWGYADMAKPLGATLVNLCQPAPYADYAAFPVGAQASVYDTFWLNGRLQEVEVFISIAKMKCHSVMGVTLALKNLVGLAPIATYRRKAEDNNRSAFHGPTTYDTRLPRVILDLNLARPIHLAVIDGIATCEAGAGPWDKTLTQVKPGLLVAGWDAVATDTVATALMGFDPQAAAQTLPFTHTDNYLALAHDLGLGVNHLDEIRVAGGPLETWRYPFKPAG